MIFRRRRKVKTVFISSPLKNWRDGHLTIFLKCQKTFSKTIFGCQNLLETTQFLKQNITWSYIYIFWGIFILDLMLHLIQELSQTSFFSHFLPKIGHVLLHILQPLILALKIFLPQDIFHPVTFSALWHF